MSYDKFGYLILVSLNLPPNVFRVYLLLDTLAIIIHLKEFLLVYITNITTTDAQGDNPEIAALTSETFEIRDTKLYVPVVTLSSENNNKLTQQLKTEVKRTVKWKKFSSEMSNQTVNNNLNYLIDSTFTNVNRLFILSFKKEHGNDDEDESARNSFKKYYVPKFGIKYFNVLINGKPVFEIPIKNKEEAYEAIIEMSKQ